MIKLFLLIVLLSVVSDAATFTTLKVGNGSSIDPSAILEVQGTTGALLFPRMTTSQKNANAATNGDIVYDTNLGAFSGYQNGAWSSLGAGGGSSVANIATQITVTPASNYSSYYPLFVASSNSAYQVAQVNSGFSFNPSSGVLSANTFSGTLYNGTSVSSQSATTASSANATYFPVFVASSSSAYQVNRMNSSFTFNPSTGVLSAPSFSGVVSGAGSTIASASYKTSTSNYANYFPSFVSSSSSAIQVDQINSGLTFNPSSGYLTANTFVGNIYGGASSASLVATELTSINATFYPMFVSNSGSLFQVPRIDSSYTYNPFTNILTAPTVVATLYGGTSTASASGTTSASNYATYFPLFVASSSSATQVSQMNSGLTFNPLSGYLTANTFVGTLYNGTSVSSESATTATSSNASYFPVFVASSSSAYQVNQMNSGFTFNPSTGALGATTFNGTLYNGTSVASSSYKTSASNYATYFPLFVSSSSSAIQVDNLNSGLTFNPSSGYLTANTFVGTLYNGTSVASEHATTSTSTNSTFFPLFVASSSSAYQVSQLNSGLTFNPSTGVLTAPSFSGSFSGSISNAQSSASVATTGTSNYASYYPLFVASSSSAYQVTQLNSGLNYNPSSGYLTANTFVGTLYGGTSVAALGATTSTVTNSTMYPTFVASSSSAYQVTQVNSAFTFNPSLGTLTSNIYVPGFLSTTTAGTTTTLTNASAETQYFAGSSGQTLQLPAVSTLSLGQTYTLINNSQGALVINSSGGNLVGTLPANSYGSVIVIFGSGTTASSWLFRYNAASSSTAISYFSGYMPESSTWTYNTSSLADPSSHSGSNTLTTRFASGITVTAAGSSLPGISFTPASTTSVYLITARITASWAAASGAVFSLTDGTTQIQTSGAGGNSASIGSESITMSGLYVPGSTSSVTVKIQASNTVGAASTSNIGTSSGENPIEWVVTQIPNNIIGSSLLINPFDTNPNANGLQLTTVSGSSIALAMEPANGSNPGGVSTTAQTLGAGVKTFSSNPVFAAMSTSGVLLNDSSGNVTSSAGPLLFVNGGTSASTLSGARTQLGIQYGASVITSGTTYTVNANTNFNTFHRFTILGGGGGGGPVSATPNIRGTGGGSACTGFINSTGLISGGSVLTIAIGNGGSGGNPNGTSATGGNGGTTSLALGNSPALTYTAGGGGAGNNGASMAGGSGGTCSSNFANAYPNYSVSGQGGQGDGQALNSLPQPAGGSSLFGLGGSGTQPNINGTGPNATGWGAGGGGATTNNGSPAAAAGGTGSQGVIIDEWWN